MGMAQDGLEKVLHVEVLLVVAGELGDDRILGRHRKGQPAPEPGNHPLRRGGRVRGDADDVLALPPSRLAEEPLLTAVVVVDVEEEVARRVVEGPTRKGAGRLPHIVFGVVADAHREALHELTGKVLVGVGLVVGAGVEPDQHRRVLRDCLGERVERARAQRSEELVLAVHEVGISDLLVRGRELLVQKQDELFPKRRVADDHPIDPPGGKRDELGVVVVAEPWDVRLR